jgi:threonine aldolase
MIADMCAKEAAIFTPTGTQSNLIGIMTHCQRGNEYIVGQTAYIYMWEGGGGAAVSGRIQTQPLDFSREIPVLVKCSRSTETLTLYPI